MLITAIDRSSAEPFYLQLARIMEGAIESGAFAAGDRMPGESDLCRRYDLARSTVRETLRHLHERGLVRLVPRRGAFVKEQDGWGLQVTAGFFEGEVDGNKREVETKILAAESCRLPEAAAQALNLAPQGAGFLLKRLRRLDGKLALYSENYLLPELQPVILGSDAVAPRGSLNRVLRAAGYHIFGARRSVAGVAAPTRIAKLLKVEPQSPLLLVTSVSWGKERRPFDYYTSWVRTDVVNVTVEAQMAGDDI
ncbi:MAG: GntR family transcriptional regulator [Proteobacteria bacterium]|nr:GntR family transcriptional regulator [Pseudomonadota bacterium]